MTAADHAIVGADWGDAGVLSQVIADAFPSLDVPRWLVPGRGARREVFPGYTRLFAGYGLTAGLAHTTNPQPDRRHGADPRRGGLAGPAGRMHRPAPRANRPAGRPVPGPGRCRREPLPGRFPLPLPATTCHYLAILAVLRTGRPRELAPRCCMLTTRCSAARGYPPTWRPGTCGPATCTWPTGMPAIASRSSCSPMVPPSIRCSAGLYEQ
jgi:hypothetical protein